jgi:hypothetical protein
MGHHTRHGSVEHPLMNTHSAFPQFPLILAMITTSPEDTVLAKTNAQGFRYFFATISVTNTPFHFTISWAAPNPCSQRMIVILGDVMKRVPSKSVSEPISLRKRVKRTPLAFA